MAALACQATVLSWPGVLAAVTKDLSANHEGVREADALGLLREGICIAGEPSHNAIVLGARGIAHYAVEFEGVPAHWGRPQDAANPLFALAAFLPSIERLELPSDPALGAATISAFEVASAPGGRAANAGDLLRDARPARPPRGVARGDPRRAAGARRPRRRGAPPHHGAGAPGQRDVTLRRVAVGPGGAAPRARRAGRPRASCGIYVHHVCEQRRAIADPRARDAERRARPFGLIGDAGEREHVSVSQVLDAAKVYAVTAAAGAS